MSDIAQYAQRAEAAEAKIAELTSLAAQIQSVAAGSGNAAGGGEGIGEFKAYFLDKLKNLRAQVVEEHDAFVALKAKDAEAQKEIAKLKYRVETLTREFAARLGTPVPEDIFKDEPKEAEEKGKEKEKDKKKDKDGDKEKEKDKKKKDKEKEKDDKDGDKEKEKDKKKKDKKDKDGDKEKEKDKKKKDDKEKKDDRKPSEKERKPSEKVAEPVVVHTDKPKDEPKKEEPKKGKKEEKPKKESTRTESEKGEPAKEPAKDAKKDGKKDAKKDDAGKKDAGKKDGGKKDAKKEEPKAEAKAEAKAPGGLDDKAVKACLKEGGKKGQDCAGMATFGTHFFCVTVESADGNMKLLEKVMEGMNLEVDEEAEDRKGGAGDLGKILFNANDQKLVIMCHTPKEVMEQATAAEWMKPVLAATGAKVTSESENFIQAELDNDPDNGIYSLKLRDQGISASFEFLRSKNLMIEDDSEDENYAAAAGINLNAAPGADY